MTRSRYSVLANLGTVHSWAIPGDSQGEAPTAYTLRPLNGLAFEVLNGAKKARGPAPVNADRIAKFLPEHLDFKRTDLLHAIAAAAAALGLIGKPTTYKDRASWTGFNNLYRGAAALRGLAPPDDGWMVVTSKDDPSLKDQQAFWINLPTSSVAIQNSLCTLSVTR